VGLAVLPVLGRVVGQTLTDDAVGTIPPLFPQDHNSASEVVKIAAQKNPRTRPLIRIEVSQIPV